jgi:inner membrane protein
MPTVISHVVPALALGYGLGSVRVPRAAWILGAALAVLPDADSIGYRMGIRYSDVLGHRGVSHSLLFAVFAAGLASLLFWLSTGRRHSLSVLSAYLAIVAASHGCLDALTNGGLGVAFLAPFSNQRFFFPARPILVAPLSIHAFFGPWGARVLMSELVWVGIPCLVVALVLRVIAGQGTEPRPNPALQRTRFTRR